MIYPTYPVLFCLSRISWCLVYPAYPAVLSIPQILLSSLSLISCAVLSIPPTYPDVLSIPHFLHSCLSLISCCLIYPTFPAVLSVLFRILSKLCSICRSGSPFTQYPNVLNKKWNTISSRSTTKQKVPLWFPPDDASPWSPPPFGWCPYNWIFLYIYIIHICSLSLFPQEYRGQSPLPSLLWHFIRPPVFRVLWPGQNTEQLSQPFSFSALLKKLRRQILCLKMYL